MKTIDDSTAGEQSSVGPTSTAVSRLAGRLGSPFGRTPFTGSPTDRNPNIALMVAGTVPKSISPDDLISDRFKYIAETGHDPVRDSPASRSEVAWTVCLHLANQYHLVHGNQLKQSVASKMIAEYLLRPGLTISEHYAHRANGRYRPHDAARLATHDASKAVQWVADNPPVRTRAAAREELAVNGVMALAYLRSRLDCRDSTTVDVWRFLLARAREEGFLSVGASLREIGDDIGRSAASVMRATRRLEDIGLISVRDRPHAIAERTKWTLDPDCWVNRQIPDRFLPDHSQVQESMSHKVSSHDAFAPTGLGRMAGDVMSVIRSTGSEILENDLQNRLHYQAEAVHHAIEELVGAGMIDSVELDGQRILAPVNRDQQHTMMDAAAQCYGTAGYQDRVREIHQMEREWFHGEFRITMSRAARLRYAIFLVVEAVEHDSCNNSILIDTSSGAASCIDTATGDTVTLSEMWKRAGYNSYLESLEGMDARFPIGTITDDIIEAFTV